MQKWMLVIALLTLIVASIGLYPQLSNQKKISVLLFSSISLVENDPVFDDIQVNYKGQQIKNLTKYEFVLRNDGNEPIIKEDIVSPIIFNFGKDGNIVKHAKLLTKPEGVTYQVINPQNNTISVTFDLLNPDDWIVFSVYVDSGKESEISVDGRIKGVKEIEYNSITEWKAPEKKFPKGLLYAYGFLVPLLLFIGYYSFKWLRGGLLLSGYIINNPECFKNISNEVQLDSFINSKLSYLPAKRKAKFRNLILKDQLFEPEIIRELVVNYANETNFHVMSFAIFLLFFLCALFYLISGFAVYFGS